MEQKAHWVNNGHFGEYGDGDGGIKKKAHCAQIFKKNKEKNS